MSGKAIIILNAKYSKPKSYICINVICVSMVISLTDSSVNRWIIYTKINSRQNETRRTSEFLILIRYTNYHSNLLVKWRSEIFIFQKTLSTWSFLRFVCTSISNVEQVKICRNANCGENYCVLWFAIENSCELKKTSVYDKWLFHGIWLTMPYFFGHNTGFFL